MKQNDWDVHAMKADVLKALAHPLRIAIVEFLGGHQRSVSEITHHLRARQPNISRHLALMVRAGILRKRKQGLAVLYRRGAPGIPKLLSYADGIVLARLHNDTRNLSRWAQRKIAPNLLAAQRRARGGSRRL